MSNRRNLPIERNNTHFVLGAVAAGLALALPRSSAWQKPLAAAAAFEFGMALLRAPHPASHLEEDADQAVAPELTRSAMIDGVLMRWEEHGGRKGDDVPVVMVHGIPTNPPIWRYIIPRQVRTFRLWYGLRRLDIPARVVWGEEDPLGEWSGAPLADTLGARMRRIPGAKALHARRPSRHHREGDPKRSATGRGQPEPCFENSGSPGSPPLKPNSSTRPRVMSAFLTGVSYALPIFQGTSAVPWGFPELELSAF